MQASIALDSGSQGPFYPGSYLSGTATLHKSSQQSIRSANVILFGHAVTHGSKSEVINTGQTVPYTYADDSKLFRIEQPMSQTGPNSWRFDLRFPDITDAPQAISSYSQETRFKGVYFNQPHGLPPSFQMIANATTYGIIEYNVQSVIEVDGQRDPITDQLPEPLILLARSHQMPPQQPPVEFIKIPEKYSSSRLQGGATSKRMGFSDRFSSNTPSVEVVIKANAPTVLHTGRTFTINVAVELGSPSSPSISVRSVKLSFKDLELRKITYIRCIRPNDQFYQSAGGHKTIETKGEEPVRLNSIPESVNAAQQLNESYGRKVWLYPASFEVRVPGSTCPGFSTFNITHSFRIVMKIEAEIAGKKFKYDVDIPNVLVLPPN